MRGGPTRTNRSGGGPPGVPGGTRTVLRERMHRRVRGPPARASAKDFTAAWLPGAPAHCLRSAEVTESYVVEATSHAKPPAIVLGGIVPDDMVAALPLAPPPGFIRPVPLKPWQPWPEWLEGDSEAAPACTRQDLEGICT